MASKAIVHDFTAVGLSAEIVAKPGDTLLMKMVTFAGGNNGVIDVEESLNGGQTWKAIKTFHGSVSAELNVDNFKTVPGAGREQVRYRLRAVSYVSGTLRGYLQSHLPADGSRTHATGIAHMEDYGIIGGGEVDNAFLIERAIGDLPAPGGVLQFPAGDFRSTRAVTPDKDIVIRGSGNRVTTLRVWKRSAGPNGCIEIASDVKIAVEDIAISGRQYGTTTNFTANGIFLVNGTGNISEPLTLRRVWFDGMTTPVLVSNHICDLEADDVVHFTDAGTTTSAITFRLASGAVAWARRWRGIGGKAGLGSNTGVEIHLKECLVALPISCGRLVAIGCDFVSGGLSGEASGITVTGDHNVIAFCKFPASGGGSTRSIDIGSAAARTITIGNDFSVAGSSETIRVAGQRHTLYPGPDEKIAENGANWSSYIGGSRLNRTIGATSDAKTLEGYSSRAISGAATLNVDDSIILADASGGAYTVDLPAAANYTNKKFLIKKTDSSANAVTVDGNGSETIDGATTVALASQYDFIEIVSDGTEWHIVGTNF